MIIFNNVSKDYGITSQVLINIDLKINTGELVFFVGASGSGKSSILRLIAGIIKPTHGQVNVQGRVLSAISYRGLSLAHREMGIIMEDFNLFHGLTLHENIEIPLIIKNIPKKERDELVINITDQLGLNQRRHFLAKELSSQERKMGMIARALITNPGLVIADEPLEELEPKWTEKLVAKLSDIHKKGTTIVITTCDTKTAENFPERKRIITLSQGKIIHYEIGKASTDKLEGILDNV
ncbi:MAG: ATP-binding cassette domain-containing protein [Candidatus Firestonebacteria bacterium]|nr:ATP-binding cassette domain-containing protein [Candidatus Firestonebacteria bacterium]